MPTVHAEVRRGNAQLSEAAQGAATETQYSPWKLANAQPSVCLVCACLRSLLIHHHYRLRTPVLRSDLHVTA